MFKKHKIFLNNRNFYFKNSNSSSINRLNLFHLNFAYVSKKKNKIYSQTVETQMTILILILHDS